MISDPRTILQNDMPLIVFSDGTFDFISFLIKWRTQGDYNHAMIARTQGKFVWQAFSTYLEAPMDSYMKKGGRLKFVRLLNINQRAIDALNKSLDDRLAMPWWRKSYDWIGIFGQIIGQEWIHTPGLEYCSEDCVRQLKTIAPFLPQVDQLVINAIGNQFNPQQLEAHCQNHPETFAEFGKWEADDGIIA